MYSFIDQATLEKFVESRTTHYFLEKSQKRKENGAINIYPYRLSRGGYKRLEKNLMDEKRKKGMKSMGDSISLDQSPSPQSRYKKWKRSRQKEKTVSTHQMLYGK